MVTAEQSSEFKEEKENEANTAEKKAEDVNSTGKNQPLIDYSSMTKEELTSFVEARLNSENPLKISSEVTRAKDTMEAILEKEYKEALDNFLAEGHDKIDFVPKADPLKDRFFKAYKQFRKEKNDFLKEREKTLNENLKIKEAIIDKLKKITDDATMAPRHKEVKKLQNQWKNTGPVPAANAEKINKTYHFYLRKFFSNLDVYGQFIELDRKKNLEAKENICTKTEALAEESDIQNARHKLKHYEDEWKKTGPVPREKESEIETRFKNAVTRFYQVLEAHEEQDREKQEENFKLKQELLQQIESYCDFTSEHAREWAEKNDELQKLIEKWHATGPVPSGKVKEMKSKFNTAVRTFNKNKNAFFKSLKQERKTILQKKHQLLEKIEQILTEKDLTPFKKTVIDIQKEWKEAGFIPQKDAKKLNDRFQKLCNQYFDGLTKANEALEKAKMSNIREKEAFLEELHNKDAPASIEEARKMIEALKVKWQELGDVPPDRAQKLNKQFADTLQKLLEPLSHQDPDVNPQLLAYQVEAEGWLNAQDSRDKIEVEFNRINKKLGGLKKEIKTLDNNLNMLSGSGNFVEEMKQNYRDKINNLEEEAYLLEEKLNILKEVKQQHKSE